jgi:hypothetical protein
MSLRFKIICLPALLVCFLGCKELPISEFKQKYHWAYDTVTVVYYNNKSIGYEFEYNNKSYSISKYAFPNQDIGDKYLILLDKMSPDKNYIILLHQPVKPTPIYISNVFGIINDIARTSNYIILEYRVYLPTNAESGRQQSFNYTEFVSLEYYDKLLSAYNANDSIEVEMYAVKVRKSDSLTTYKPFIKFKK